MTFDLQKIIRPNIKNLKAYSSARDEYSKQDGIFLDANENPYGEINRYPDPYQKKLKNRISEIFEVPAQNIFLGNGSDEVIDLLFRIFCRPKIDKVLSFTPTYGMYKVSADINDVEYVKQKLNSNFHINEKQLMEVIKDENLKIIFICSPNNPTGNNMDFDMIYRIAQNFHGIVFVDQAYADFSDLSLNNTSFSNYPNIVISRTMSKAYGMAAARLGIAFASENIIKLYNRTKPPYNISQINQDVVFEKLKNLNKIIVEYESITNSKPLLKAQLEKFSFVEKIYPSEANFFLIKVNDANLIYNELISRNIIIRNRHSVAENCVRITVGSTYENQNLLKALSEIEQNLKNN